MNCSPAMIRWTAVSSASWPVTGTSCRIHAVRLHRGDRATRSAVVRGVDTCDLICAGRRDRLLHLALRVLRQPIRSVVLLRDLDALLLEHLGRALAEQGCVVVLRIAVDLHDRALVVAVRGELLGQRSRLLAPHLEAVERDVVVEIGVEDQAVVGDDRDVGLPAPAWRASPPWSSRPGRAPSRRRPR